MPVDRENELEGDGDGPQEDFLAPLRALAIFAAFDEAALAPLAARAGRMVLDAGETLFEAGAAADCGYVLLSGRIALSDTRRDGAPHGAMEVGPGALIGEIALIAPTPRPATAVALEACALLRLDRADVLPLLAANPRAAAKLRRAFAIRLEQLMKALDGVRLELERSGSTPRKR
ncbi:Crp/Fnr family transcriptional regulator [Xanthobacter sediminis]|uniref:Crp/Fnr family transcriptional regulator n=1 Tax=Xanthobacter sediminis TaxID=3119926 RepID=UPI00372C5208